MDINAIERVLDKRSARGASDESLILWLESLKKEWDSPYHQATLNRFINAIKLTPIK